MKLRFPIVLRWYAYLRRATIALERLATAQESMAEIILAREQSRRARLTRKPKKTVFGELDIAEVNKEWRRRRQEQGESLEDQEDLDVLL